MNHDKEKHIELAPSWKNFFWWYLLGLLLLPIGIGILILWFAHQKKVNLKFQITDNSISVVKNGKHESILLLDIVQSSIMQSATQRLFDIGDIILQTKVHSITLIGIEKPKQLLLNIEKAIAYQKTKADTSHQIKPNAPSHDPGMLDRLDYLTGLWQQGLVSNEDYEEERKKLDRG